MSSESEKGGNNIVQFPVRLSDEEKHEASEAFIHTVAAAVGQCPNCMAGVSEGYHATLGRHVAVITIHPREEVKDLEPNVPLSPDQKARPGMPVAILLIDDKDRENLYPVNQSTGKPDFSRGLTEQ